MQFKSIEAEQQASSRVGFAPARREHDVVLRCWSGLRHGPYAWTALCGKIGVHLAAVCVPPMVVPKRTGFSAAVAAAVMLAVPGFTGSALRAEERINWLKTPAAVRSLQAPPPLPSPPNLPPQTYRYRLAPGDRLVTSVFKIEGYEAEVQVLSDGTINLPRLGTVDVWGLTLDEARQRITNGYSQFLRRPLVYLDLVEQRPVRVTVTGQVLRSGVFTLPVDSRGGVGPSGDPTGVGADGGGWPTMVDVIQKAGGISATGDLTRLELLRASPTPGGPTQSYVFDYLTVLKN